MIRIHKFVRLSWAEWRLLLEAAGALMLVSMALRLCGFSRVRRIVRADPRRTPRLGVPAARIAWAMRAVGARVPGGRNCLVQALAAQIVLRRHGHASRVRIGVRGPTTGVFGAHAWVECDGRVVVGGSSDSWPGALALDAS